MRSVRPIPPCPRRLAPAESAGAEERASAIAHFTAEDRASRPAFAFRAYKHDEIRDALLDAFDRVCAYCEAPVPSIEIEHYRPKGAIQTEAGRRSPGYYWLAADWENLLPSCHPCNTRLRTEYADGRRSSGKGTWFPLEDESSRATAAGEEARERPLLLHPYFDEPADHLEFVEEGVVRPRRDADGAPSRKGDTTITLLGLNRRGLPDARRDRQVVLAVAHRAALDAQARCKEQPQDEELAAEHRRCVEELERLQRPAAGFSAMAAQQVGLLGAAPVG
jgi:uncharacterized protein (TIGR02646 family)